MTHQERIVAFSGAGRKIALSSKNDECTWSTTVGSTRHADVLNPSPSKRPGVRVAEYPTEPASKKAEASSRSANRRLSVNRSFVGLVMTIGTVIAWILAPEVEPHLARVDDVSRIDARHGHGGAMVV
jgi:hypothetical protein